MDLDDWDPMPFGKHEGKAMRDVPASYLNFLWNNGMRQKWPGESNVADYIRKKLPVFRTDHPNRKW